MTRPPPAHATSSTVRRLVSLKVAPDLVASSLLFFNDTATTEIYTLSQHDALPIFLDLLRHLGLGLWRGHAARLAHVAEDLDEDRKSTRLNSSHGYIPQAAFCL